MNTSRPLTSDVALNEFLRTRQAPRVRQERHRPTPEQISIRRYDAETETLLAGTRYWQAPNERRKA